LSKRKPAANMILGLSAMAARNPSMVENSDLTAILATTSVFVKNAIGKTRSIFTSSTARRSP